LTTPEEILEEEKKIRFLKTIVDLTTAVLKGGQVSREEAVDIIRATKKRVLELFPEKEATYNLIYKPRFERLLQEFLSKKSHLISEKGGEIEKGNSHFSGSSDC